MRVIIITQNEPFYLADNLRYLFKLIPEHSEIVGCVVADASPFGKKDGFVGKAKQTLSVFGLKFFMHYAFKFVSSKLNRKKQIAPLLADHNIPIIPITGNINSKASVELIQSYQPDLLVSILGNSLFKKPIIDLAPKGCINLHTALLPKYRGLMPTFWVLKNKEPETGVSVFFVDEGIDSGPIIVQERVKLTDQTQEQLIVQTKKIGMELIAKSIDLIEKDEVELLENDASQMTYFSFPEKKDVAEFVANGKRFF